MPAGSRRYGRLEGGGPRSAVVRHFVPPYRSLPGGKSANHNLRWIHLVEQRDVRFLDHAPLELHRDRHLAALDREILLDDAEVLDLLEARERLVHDLDL